MASALSFFCQSRAAGQSEASGSGACGFGYDAARACLVAWGADPQKTSRAWVANHYKWIVWKLASYDRKLLHGCGAGAGVGTACLTVSNVILQLQRRCGAGVARHAAACRSIGHTQVCVKTGAQQQHPAMLLIQPRYDLEIRGGRPSVLKRVLQHDLGAGMPMVLVVSDIRTNAGVGAKGQQQQQQQQQQPEGGGGGGGGGAGAAQVLGIQLSDGWYHINACVDEPLAHLLLTGRLQVRAACGNAN